MKNNLREERLKRNIKASHVAKCVGVNPSTVTAWEQGKTSIPSTAIVKLCKLLSCSADTLLGLNTDETKRVPIKPRVRAEIRRDIAKSKDTIASAYQAINDAQVLICSTDTSPSATSKSLLFAQENLRKAVKHLEQAYKDIEHE